MSPSVLRDSESVRNKDPSLSVLIHLYKNLSENQLIRCWSQLTESTKIEIFDTISQRTDIREAENT